MTVTPVADEAFDLSGAVTVVTGATRGIGKHAALALGRSGARLVLVGRTRVESANQALPGSLDGVAAELAAEGIEVRVVQADLTDPGQTEEIVRLTLEWFGRCNVSSDVVSPAEVGDQIAWLVRQPSTWSGQSVSCAQVVRLGGPGTSDKP